MQKLIQHIALVLVLASAPLRAAERPNILWLVGEDSRQPGAYPVARVFELASLASERDPKNLPRFLAALSDSSEPVRWWAAQGCTLLRDESASAEPALRQCLADTPGAVQVAAAEARARQGQLPLALPVLERWLQNMNNLAFALQAANVLGRLGEAARPALPTLKRVLARPVAASGGALMPGYLQRILERRTAVLEGELPALVYPAVGVAPSRAAARQGDSNDLPASQSQ